MTRINRIQTLRLAPIAALLCSASFIAMAQTKPAKAATTHVANVPSKTVRKSTKAPLPVVPEPVVADATPEQVEAAGQVYYGLYDCEFKQTINIDKSTQHAAYVDVRQGKLVWLMKPVLSSTGAIRLEDVRGETLMVQISSKSMLLNVKTARRVVDDCVSPRQHELIEEARAAKAAATQAKAAEAAKPASESAAANNAPAAPETVSAVAVPAPK